jgi:predicted dehydrogenase
MAREVKVGIIGTGGIGRRQVQTLVKMDGVKLVAGADVSDAALAEFRKQFNVTNTYKDYNEMLAKEKFDAVTVCTPNYLHKDPTIAALKAGADVMVEKPMAMNAAEAREMVETARNLGRKLVIGFQWRLTPQAQALKKQINKGLLGDPLFCRVQALRRRGIPNWGVFGRKELQGGGPLIDIGVHIIEMGHYLMGKPKPVAACASAYTYLGNKPSEALCAWDNWDYKTYTVEDLAVGFIRFANGACMTVESSFAAHIEHDVFNVQIMGTRGGCTFSPLKIFRDEAGLMMNAEPAFVGHWDSMDKKLENWIAYVRGEAETECPGEDGMVVQQILDGLYASAEKGSEVQIQ